jgi:hypothetical protein
MPGSTDPSRCNARRRGRRQEILGSDVSGHWAQTASSVSVHWREERSEEIALQLAIRLTNTKKSPKALSAAFCAPLIPRILREINLNIKKKCLTPVVDCKIEINDTKTT